MDEPFLDVTEGEGPLVAAAIHSGHAVRQEVAENLNLSPAERLREEDPFTDRWTNLAETRIVGNRSRFEVDLNRPRDKAVYLVPEDAWGLHVRKTPPRRDVVARSLAQYDAFYETVETLLARLIERHGRIVVLDLHSYNHRRLGPDAEQADPIENPEVNVGTGTMDRKRWEVVVNRFIQDLRSFDFGGRGLQVGENVKFRGGYFPRHIHDRFPSAVCVLSVEFKKFFMDEWTGELDVGLSRMISAALKSTVPGLRESLIALNGA